MTARGLTVAFLLALPGSGTGCDESLYAPSAEVVPCGTADHPCRFTCDPASESGCAATAVQMAEACMQSMQGTLNAAHTRCDFPDGTRATFAWPVPDVGADLSARSWKLALQRADATAPCISVTAEPLPWVAGGFRSKTEVQTPNGTYRQELSMREHGGLAFDDGGGVLPEIDRLEVRCAGGRHYRGEGRAVCSDCPESDCRKLPLVELRAGWNGATLDFELRAGERITPLFSCL